MFINPPLRPEVWLNTEVITDAPHIGKVLYIHPFALAAGALDFWCLGDNKYVAVVYQRHKKTSYK